NAHFTALVGSAAARAVQAFGQDEYASCVRLLRGIRGVAHRFGGSHAQRDVLDLTLLEAARRAGMQVLAQGLQAERIALRPGADQSWTSASPIPSNEARTRSPGFASSNPHQVPVVTTVPCATVAPSRVA